MDWELAVIAAALLGFSVVSRPLAGTSLTSAMVFVGVGLLVGTQALDLFDAPSTAEFVKVLAEATLAFVLFSDASRIDLRALRREYTVPARLLGFGLPLTIVLGAILAALIFEQISFTEAVIVAVLLAPTDAALGQAVVTEKRLPSRIRQGLNVEGGLNDGLCVPLLFIALAVAEADAGSIGDAHAVRLVTEQIGWGICGGVIGGALTAAVVAVGIRRGLIEASWLQVVPAAGAGLAYGFAAPLGGSGFIAAFVAGMVFSALRRPDRGEVTYLTDQLGEVLNAVTLLAFGAVLLSPALGDLDWRIGIYAIASLTVVRMLPVAIALLGTGARRPTIAFVGWFGPRGLASLVFALIVIHDAHLPHVGTIVSVTYVTVGLSVLVHGVSAAPLTRRYVSWFESHPADRRPVMESVPAAAHRWRHPAGVLGTNPPSPGSGEPDGTPPDRVTLESSA
jgi:sodium/hydrogen antiporter